MVPEPIGVKNRLNVQGMDQRVPNVPVADTPVDKDGMTQEHKEIAPEPDKYKFTEPARHSQTEAPDS